MLRTRPSSRRNVPGPLFPTAEMKTAERCRANRAARTFQNQTVRRLGHRLWCQRSWFTSWFCSESHIILVDDFLNRTLPQFTYL